MNQEQISDPPNEEDVYDLDLEEEAESDPEDVIREAIEAVDARVEKRTGELAVPEALRRGQTEAASESEIEEADAAPAAAQSAENADGSSGSDDSHGSDASERLSLLEVELAEAKERAVRALADYENYRRRTERSRVEERRYAAEGVLRECLDVVDNLDRALEAEGDLEDLKRGVEMINRQLQDVLERAGVARIAAQGERFDPSIHEAVARVESREVATATVAEEYQSGFKLHDRLLRASKVVVAVPTGDSSTDKDEAEDSQD